jgi:hypothetical protein
VQYDPLFSRWWVCVTDPIPQRVVSAVAETTGHSTADLPPLYETVDGDALQALAGDGVLIRFEYADCLVTVEDGDVAVSPQEDGPAGDAA